MEKDKENKILNVPALRFPEFTGEWKEERLSKIAELSKGVGISKEQLSEDGEPCILYGELYTKYKSEIIHKVISKTNIESSNLKRSKRNDVIIPCSGETAIDIAVARCVPFDNILLGGDLNIIRLHKDDGAFMAYQLNGKRKIDIAKLAQGVSVVHLYGENIKAIKTYNPCLQEQQKIVKLLSMLDERLEVQNKIIEKLETLIKGIVELAFNHAATSNTLGCYITQISQRNKTGKDLPVLSVSNKHGFVEQSEQFEDRIIASDDTSNYKMVSINDFAFNPARINVGSIARLKDKERGIVSPMYICFRTLKDILPEYLELFFKTFTFSSEVRKRLEGSVRLCLSYESLCEIVIPVISIKEQQSLVKMVTAFYSKLKVEKGFLRSYQLQKQYLLSQMLI
jgi:type I restriction enzyme S subunit